MKACSLEAVTVFNRIFDDVLNIFMLVIKAQGLYVHYVLCICLQDRVCCGENADQLVYIPPVQVSKGNSKLCFLNKLMSSPVFLIFFYSD